jgi:hypothetical protein
MPGAPVEEALHELSAGSGVACAGEPVDQHPARVGPIPQTQVRAACVEISLGVGGLKLDVLDEVRDSVTKGAPLQGVGSSAEQ